MELQNIIRIKNFEKSRYLFGHAEIFTMYNI